MSYQFLCDHESGNPGLRVGELEFSGDDCPIPLGHYSCRVLTRALFLFRTIPETLVAAIILPILFGLVYWGLLQNRLNENEGSFLNRLAGHVTVWKYITLFGIPLMSIPVYAIAMTLNLRWNTNWFFI